MYRKATRGTKHPDNRWYIDEFVHLQMISKLDHPAPGKPKCSGTQSLLYTGMKYKQEQRGEGGRENKLDNTIRRVDSARLDEGMTLSLPRDANYVNNPTASASAHAQSEVDINIAE